MSWTFTLIIVFCRWLEYLSVHSTLQQFHHDNDNEERNLTVVLTQPFISSEYPEYMTYKRLTLSNYVLKSDRRGDSCCFWENEQFLEISFFARSKATGQLFVAGRKYLKCTPLYDDVQCSSEAGVYRCSVLASDVQFYPIDKSNEDTLKKVYRLPLFGTKDFVCSTLLHGM